MNVAEWPTSTRIAAGALLAALAIDAYILFRPRPIETAPALTLQPVQRSAVRPIADADIVRAASNREPFGATEPALETFVGNGGVPSPAMAMEPTRPRLLGTVVEGQGGGFVVVSHPDSRVQLVRLGEMAGDLRLKSVAVGLAEFTDANGSRVTLKIPPPESRP